jgi:hypothetical protein
MLTFTINSKITLPVTMLFKHSSNYRKWMELKFYHILPIAPSLLLKIMDCSERCSIFFVGKNLKMQRKSKSHAATSLYPTTSAGTVTRSGNYGIDREKSWNLMVYILNNNFTFVAFWWFFFLIKFCYIFSSGENVWPNLIWSDVGSLAVTSSVAKTK